MQGENVEPRDKILSAAYEEFVEKGFAGARMQEIADRAEVNKAMLHYYFRNKENLYSETIIATLVRLLAELNPAFNHSDCSYEERMRMFVTAYIDFVSANPGVLRLLVQDLMGDVSKLPKLFEIAFERSGLTRVFPMVVVLRDGIENNTFKQINIQHTLISIIGMSLFYFIGKPIIDSVLGISESDDSTFLAERKENIIEIMFHGILAPHEHEIHTAEEIQ